MQYGSEFKEMNHKRWNGPILEGDLRQLIEELLIKEKLHKQITEKELRQEFEREVKDLSRTISHELTRLQNLFRNDAFVSSLTDSTFIGIDFGTSNSVVSYMCYYADRKDFKLTLPQPIEFPFYKPKFVNEFIVPSAVFYDEEDDILHFGIDAKRNKRNQHVEGRNYWSSVKTKLGLNYGDVFYDSKLKQGHKYGSILNPDQAAESYLRWLKTQIEEYISNNNLPKNTYYSVSIPASFSSNKRQAYLKILDRIGINTSESVLIDEPNAAFLNCLISLDINKINSFQQSHILVFDFGAGTCDISILEYEVV